MRALGRILLLPIAFVLASLASLFVILTLGHERIIQGVAAHRPDEATIDAMFDLLRLGLSFASAQSLLPALLVAIGGEVARIRSVLYYVVGGGAALVAVPLLSAGAGLPGPAEDAELTFEVETGPRGPGLR